MLATVINILSCMILTSGIAFYLGFMFGRTKAYSGKVRINPIFKNKCNIYNKPLILSLPKRGGKDNLLEINGINEDLEKELNKLGIFHFEQISRWTNKNIEWIELFFSIEDKITSEKWVSQANDLLIKK